MTQKQIKTSSAHFYLKGSNKTWLTKLARENAVEAAPLLNHILDDLRTHYPAPKGKRGRPSKIVTETPVHRAPRVTKTRPIRPRMSQTTTNKGWQGFKLRIFPNLQSRAA